MKNRWGKKLLVCVKCGFDVGFGWGWEGGGRGGLYASEEGSAGGEVTLYDAGITSWVRGGEMVLEGSMASEEPRVCARTMGNVLEPRERCGNVRNDMRKG